MCIICILTDLVVAQKYYFGFVSLFSSIFLDETSHKYCSMSYNFFLFDMYKYICIICG